MFEKSKSILFWLLIFLGICSCISSKKNIPDTMIRRSEQKIIQPVFPVSGTTKIFLSQYALLTPKQLKEDQNPPFAELIQRYHLQQTGNGEYALCGFIKTDASFQAMQLEAKGIQLTPPAADFRTVCIPLKLLEYFFSQPGIIYFENTMTVNPL